MAFVAGYLFLESAISSAFAGPPGSVVEWGTIRAHLRWGFMIIAVVCLVAIGVENIFFFHTIVGPIYALENAIKKIASGNYNDVTHIRDSDQLSEVVMAFEDMRIKILSRIDSQNSALRGSLHELEELAAQSTPANIGILRDKIKATQTLLEKKTA